ncbi:hypothetical protein Tco_0223913 [Tanacetum coccineum]
MFFTGEATCSRGIGGRRSNFIHDNDVRNSTGPSTSRARRDARGNPDVSLTTGEATCSRGIEGRRSNFIHDNDVHYGFRSRQPAESSKGFFLVRGDDVALQS